MRAELKKSFIVVWKNKKKMTDQPEKDVPVEITIPDALLEDLQAQAQSLGVPLDEFIKMFLEHLRDELGF